jgi:type III pantothenate kinase
MEINLFAAADLGNTFLKLCVFRGVRIAAGTRIAYRGKPEAAFRKAAAWLAGRSVKAVTLCSVNRSAEKVLDGRLKHRGIKKIRLRKKLPPGMRSAYDIARIGADRLANIVAARRDYPEKNLLVLCAGTALTLDAIEGPLHLGGFIVPGPRTLLSSLHERTDLLPRLRAEAPIRRPGRNTREAISGGCSLFFSGGARRLAGFISASRKKKFRVILTGGGMATLGKVFPAAKKDGDLACRGIRYLAER